MRIRLGSVAFVGLFCLLCALPALGCQAATDVTGDWVLTWSFGGETRDVNLHLEQTEGNIRGAWAGPYGSPIELTGTLEEDTITLMIPLPPTAGSPEITLTLTGTVEGDSMGGTLDFGGMAEGTWSAVRSQ